MKVLRTVSRGHVLALLAAVLLAGSETLARADLMQSGNCDITAGGNDPLPGTGFSFTNYVWTGNGQLLNMGGYYIKNSVDTSGFTLDLANWGLSSSATAGTVSLSTSGQGGNITLQNLGVIMLGDVVTLGTTTLKSGNFVVTNQAGNATFGNIWTQNNTGNNAGPNAGNIVIVGNGAGTLTARTILAEVDHNGSGGNINISGYSALNVTGTATVPNAAVPAAAGIQTQGRWYGSAGIVTINVGAGGVSANGIITATTAAAGGAVHITTTGAASLGNITTAALGGQATDVGGLVSITTGGSAAGSLSFGTINTFGGNSGSGGAGAVTLNGTDKSGALTGHDIFTSGVRSPGNVVISNYYGVTLDTYGTAPNTSDGVSYGSIVTANNWGNGGNVTISNIGAGGVTLAGFSTSSRYGDSTCHDGTVSITAVAGNINIADKINITAYSDSTSARGPVRLETTGAGSTISLATLDLSRVSYIALSPASKGIVKGDLLGFSTNVASQTKLRMPAGKRMMYYPDLTNNAYLQGGRYVLASVDGTPAAGGVLMPYASPGTVVTLK